MSQSIGSSNSISLPAPSPQPRSVQIIAIPEPGDRNKYSPDQVALIATTVAIGAGTLGAGLYHLGASGGIKTSRESPYINLFQRKLSDFATPAVDLKHALQEFSAAKLLSPPPSHPSGLPALNRTLQQEHAKAAVRALNTSIPHLKNLYDANTDSPQRQSDLAAKIVASIKTAQLPVDAEKQMLALHHELAKSIQGLDVLPDAQRKHFQAASEALHGTGEAAAKGLEAKAIFDRNPGTPEFSKFADHLKDQAETYAKLEPASRQFVKHLFEKAIKPAVALQTRPAALLKQYNDALKNIHVLPRA